MFNIAIIIGSTRPGRNGEAVAKWVYEIAQKRSDAEFELEPVDVSSSEIRARVARGEPIDDLVPSPVAHAIARLGLYRSAE